MKILVIEDEKLLADSIKSMLERKGFQVLDYIDAFPKKCWNVVR